VLGWGVARRRLMAIGVAALCVAGPAVSAAPRHASSTSATFATFGIPTTFGSAQYSGEPSIGINQRTHAIFFQAGGATYKFAPSTQTWTDVTPSGLSIGNIDPILATDPTSGLTLAGGDDGACSILAVTTDDGQNWQTSLPCTFTVDHPTVGIGPVVGSSPQASGRVLYYCQQYPVDDQCTTSSDGGQTWLPSVPVTGGCAGLFGHVKTGPDGTAYLPVRTCQDFSKLLISVGGAVSTNNGRSWSSYLIPNATPPGRGFDPTIAITPDNTVYESWAGYPAFKPVVAWSHDHGTSWSKAVDVSKGAPYPIYATTFPAAVAGDNGRVAVAYLGADRPGTATVTPFDNGYIGAWYLYVSATYDGGKHWTTSRVQQAPVQLGPICDNGTRCLNGRNLLDFMDAGVTNDGRVVVGYANGCAGGCPADVSQVAKSNQAWGTLAIQIGGTSLYRTTFHAL